MKFRERIVEKIVVPATPEIGKCPQCGLNLSRKVKDKGGYHSAMAKWICSNPLCGYATEYEEIPSA